MLNGYLKQSTASQTRVIGNFVDEADGFTPETALTIANTDVKLSKNGAASVNKNSGGGTHIANGMYAVTFDATDTNTVGELAGSVFLTGVARTVFFKFLVVEESVYDRLFAASAVGPLTAAEVNAQVLDVINVDTFAEPGQGAPAATTTLAAKINYLYKAWRNRKTQTTTEFSLYADDGTTVDQKATVANDGTTASITEKVTGP